jgi:hypothetical protein
MTDKPREIALIYDFDGTLARGNLQERSFFPALGIATEAFWKEVKATCRANDEDETLTYMRRMLERAKERGIRYTRAFLAEHGADADLFDGLADGSWFARIDDFCTRLGLVPHHYVISSALEEMLVGCPIARYFDHVFASKYCFVDDEAVWPSVAINYTTKTQYIFRINKGIFNHWDNKALNEYMAQSARPIRFENMIFFGDGDTDVPTMKLLTLQGGYSIAVYDPADPERSFDKIHRLLADDRVNFVSVADYSENSQLDIIVKGIIGRMAHRLAEA